MGDERVCPETFAGRLLAGDVAGALRDGVFALVESPEVGTVDCWSVG
jgi:hypothetical protein